MISYYTWTILSHTHTHKKAQPISTFPNVIKTKANRRKAGKNWTTSALFIQVHLFLTTPRAIYIRSLTLNNPFVLSALVKTLTKLWEKLRKVCQTNQHKAHQISLPTDLKQVSFLNSKAHQNKLFTVLSP